MSGAANAARGEAMLVLENAALTLRPSFAALVAAEEEIGPLFAMVERTASGALTLSEMVALFWHCVAERPEAMTREAFGEAVAKAGLAAATPALKMLLGQILGGR
jgi:hypothetical protein